MTEFNDPCAASGVFANRAVCPSCGRDVAVVGDGRYEAHSRQEGPVEPLPFGTQTSRQVVDAALPAVEDFGSRTA